MEQGPKKKGGGGSGECECVWMDVGGWLLTFLSSCHMQTEQDNNTDGQTTTEDALYSSSHLVSCFCHRLL